MGMKVYRRIELAPIRDGVCTGCGEAVLRFRADANGDAQIAGHVCFAPVELVEVDLLAVQPSSQSSSHEGGEARTDAGSVT